MRLRNQTSVIIGLGWVLLVFGAMEFMSMSPFSTAAFVGETLSVFLIGLITGTALLYVIKRESWMLFKVLYVLGYIAVIPISYLTGLSGTMLVPSQWGLSQSVRDLVFYPLAITFVGSLVPLFILVVLAGIFWSLHYGIKSASQTKNKYRHLFPQQPDARSQE